ncbi:TonB-dependent receptor plug domain-containing protein [Altererythrobacter ishigakiensis]|uniref:Vitamin B12 transporter n=1 Tax=Altererythrobacter ishigakiensis TaxID=476157 RepID=A0A562UV61_9SPHN|nr:TonB-dependent receptor [Altererythrobacter ishigakiensis]TWJ09501.1 vitamin B12 transporter [Altererythrobacter ishigakiensis]
MTLAAPALAQDAGSPDAEVDGKAVELVLAEPVPANILIVATRSDDEITTESYIGSSTVLTPLQIEQRQVRDVADVLRDVPSMAVASVAGQTQLRLRGSEANHVMVLVDGIEVSDPFAGEFDVGTLQAEIGSRIEVLRGPQSALYGSDAIGGVVAYGSGQFEGASAWIEGGSDSTFNGAARVGTRGDRWNASLSGLVVSSDGEPNARNGARDIGRDSYTLSGNSSVDVAPDLTLRAVGRFVRTEGDFNDTDFDPTSPTFGFVIDSPDTRFENEAVYALVGARLETMRGDWMNDLSVQVADIARDTFGPFGRTSGSDGDRLKASYVSSLGLGSYGNEHQLTFAADWERERFRNDDPFDFAFTGRRSIENVGIAGEYRFAFERFDFSAAARHDINDRFADETTFRIGAGIDASEHTRLRVSYGTGIKNPGFFELFGFFDGRFIGNADLSPERSESWEVGIDQLLAEGAITLSVTYFDSRLKDEIFTTFPAPDFIATPANRDTLSKQQGVELSAKAQLNDQITFDAAYSWLDAKEDGVEEVRRPGNIASAALNWTAPDGAANATLIVRYNGATDDVAFTDPSFIPLIERLDSYTLINFNGEVRLTERLRLFGRVENLLDEAYEQVFSFVSPGRSAAIGIRADF